MPAVANLLHACGWLPIAAALCLGLVQSCNIGQNLQARKHFSDHDPSSHHAYQRKRMQHKSTWSRQCSCLAHNITYQVAQAQDWHITGLGCRKNKIGRTEGMSHKGPHIALQQHCDKSMQIAQVKYSPV